MHFDQDQTFYAIAMGDAAVSFAGQEALERATIDKHGWLRPEELGSGGERPADPRAAAADAAGGGRGPRLGIVRAGTRVQLTNR